MPSTNDLLAQLRRHLPTHYDVLDPVLGGVAAALAEGLRVVDEELQGSVSVGGASGTWLTLLARGYGVRRGNAEGDASLRTRVRNAEGAVTKQALEAAANALLAEYTGEQAEVVEHWAARVFLDDEAYADDAELFDQHNAFTLRVPRLIEGGGVGGFLGVDAWADQSFADASQGADHPVYGAIIAEIERLRAAGVRWWLLLDSEVAASLWAFADDAYADIDYLGE
jgi:hypothetical protein